MTAQATSDLQRRMDALTTLVLEVSSQRHVDDVLDVALRQCLHLTGSQFGFIGLVQSDAQGRRRLGDGSALDIVAIHGFHPAADFYQRHRVIPLRPNVFSQVILQDRAVRTEDAATVPGHVGQPDGHPPVAAFLGAPLRLDGEPIGMIGLANRPVRYEDDHEALVMTYASLVAVLLGKAEAYEQLAASNARLEALVDARTRELAEARDALADKATRLQQVLIDTVDAQDGERQRIAEDIHDGITQLLIGAMLELTAGENRIATGQVDSARDSIRAAAEVLAEVEAEIRRVVHDLYPPALDHLGLPSALRVMAERFAQAAGIACRVEVHGRPVRPAPRVEVDLYRVVQEGLRNVAVHSGASAVDLRLTFTEDHLEVELADDGRGFDPAAEPRACPGTGRSRLGLASMRRRVERHDGAWCVASAPGGGTAIRATVPL